MVWGSRFWWGRCGDAGLYDLYFALPRGGRVVDAVDHIRRLHGVGCNVDEHMVGDAIEGHAGHTWNGLQDGVHLSFLAAAAGTAERQGKSFFGGWGCCSPVEIGKGLRSGVRSGRIGDANVVA